MRINSYDSLHRMFSTEAMGMGAQAAAQPSFGLFSQLTKVEEDNLNSLITKNCSVEQLDTDSFTKEQVLKYMTRKQDEKFHALTKKILGANGAPLLRHLPKATQRIVGELSARKSKLISQAATAKDLNERMAYAFESEQLGNTIEQIVFGTLTTANEVNKMNKKNMGLMYHTAMESMQTYAATVFYPVFENTVVWFNAAGTVYPKLIPIKQVMNEITQPVIHTMTYMLQKIDENSKVVAEVERSEFYRSFNDPKYDQFRQFMNREIKFDKTEFNKLINLKSDKLMHNDNKPALLPLENIKSDFTIISHKIADVEEEQGPINIKTQYNITESPAVNESYYNGQAFYYHPDPTKKDQFYIISLNYDSIGCTLLISINKAAGADELPDIETLTFNFKLHDVNFVQRNDTRWQIYERPSFLETPTANRKEINHNINEFQLMSMRNDADQMSRLMGLNTEQVGNEKETMFFKGIDRLNTALDAEKKAAKNTSTEDQILYLESTLDLATKSDLNRLEGLGLRIGGEISAFVKNYNYIAKTQMATTMSMLCHSTSTGIIAPATKAITGTVNSDSNGGFLGVDVDTRTHVMTIGTDGAAPVSAIIVGTDKDDLKAKKYDSSNQLLANGDIEYPFILFPRFQEANLATNLMIETPTRVISDPNYRSTTNPNVPATFIEYAAQFISIRNAGGKLTVKGSLVPGVL